MSQKKSPCYAGEGQFFRLKYSYAKMKGAESCDPVPLFLSKKPRRKAYSPDQRKQTGRDLGRPQRAFRNSQKDILKPMLSECSSKNSFLHLYCNSNKKGSVSGNDIKITAMAFNNFSDRRKSDSMIGRCALSGEECCSILQGQTVISIFNL